MRRLLLRVVFLTGLSFWAFLSLGHAALAEREVLPNGMTLLVTSRPTLPMVVVQVLIDAGSLREPAAKAGLANLTAELLTRGTTTRSALAISQAIDFRGGELSTEVERDYVTVSLRLLKKDLDAGLELLADLLQHPRFAPEEITRQRQETLGVLQKAEEEPDEIAEATFRQLLFGSQHPYGRRIEGTPETLRSIGREDILRFYQENYGPNRSIMAFVGDITLAEARTKVERFWGGWRPVSPPPEPPAPSLQATLPLRRIIDKPLSQATVLFGHLGIRRDNPDYYAVTVMNHILGGGGFGSRLLQKLREEHGLVYGAYSQFQSGKVPHLFWVRLETRNRAVKQALELTMQEIRRIQGTPVSPEELKAAKAYLVGSFPFRMDTNRELATLLPLLEFYQLGLDYVDRYPALIEQVSQADVLRVAQKYLHPDRSLLVVVGKEAEIEGP
ncbi:MAG: insulinase family protein [Nitrospinota bacterium]|nr:MAG: insulinase family protein [Nitrospinota bacterium]